MSPLLSIILAFAIGFIEWYMALRRTLALTRGERTLTFMLVLAEGLLAWSVLFSFLSVPTYPFDPQAASNTFALMYEFIKAYKWKILVALAASIGGAMGSLLVNNKDVNQS